MGRALSFLSFVAASILEWESTGMVLYVILASLSLYAHIKVPRVPKARSE